MNNNLILLSEYIALAEEHFGIEFLRDKEFDTVGKSQMQVKRVQKKTPELVNQYRQACTDLKNNANNTQNLKFAWSTIQFAQVLSFIKFCEKNKSFLIKIIELLKKPQYDKYNSARHELFVFGKYKQCQFSIFPIDVGAQKSPDFKITEPISALIECKSIMPEEKKDTVKIKEIVDRTKRRLEIIDTNGLMQIVLKSRDLDQVMNEINKFIEINIEKPGDQETESNICKIRFTKFPIIRHPQNFAIGHPIEKHDIGISEIRISEEGFKFIGINISPLRTHNYLSPLENQIKSAKKQFKLGELGILHVQFPEIPSKTLIDIIKNHSKLIYKHLSSNKISALILEFPYTRSVDKKMKAKVYPSISIPYLNPELDGKRLLETRPYWIDGLEFLDTSDEIKCIFIEFELNSESESSLTFFVSSDGRFQGKIILIKDTLLIETKDLYSLCFAEFRLDENIINQKNKLAYNVWSDTVSLNGGLIKGEITSHNNA